jgi:protoporphyrinogen oxidase
VGTAVLGAGPAGLTAAYVLANRGADAVVFEADDQVGGIARTVDFGEYRFDLGGHRFFTKVEPIAELWRTMLGEDFLTRPRLSRIFFNGAYFAYPLAARDVVGRLGVREASLCAFSYLRNAVRKPSKAETFEEWVTCRFGRRLYDAFFRSYTEKVWGIAGSEIQAQWAAQRIKEFSFLSAVLAMLGLKRRTPTTLIEEFQYPRLGPGQMWEAFRSYVEEHGVGVHLNHACTELHHRDGRIESMTVRTAEGESNVLVDGVVSSIPLSQLVLSLRPAAPPHVQSAARRLRYRSLCLVALVTTEEQPFPDNWIYLHDPSTRAGRVQNFGAWSDAMVAPGTTCLGVEYFCFEEDEIWQMNEAEAVELATTELARIGLIDPASVVGGTKVNVPKAYPMYDREYAAAVVVLREYLKAFSNLQTCGRNGLHRYNNQDHSMWTAVLATLNVLDGTSHDVWSVNLEENYLEEGSVVAAVLDSELATYRPRVKAHERPALSLALAHQTPQ